MNCRRLRFSDSREAIDRATVHAWLSEHATWAAGRSRALQDAAVDASVNYGVYDADTDEQLAYARLVTDRVTFGWLCDVFVAPSVRGQGIGKMLIAGVAADLDRLNLKRVMLVTEDAQGLYAQYEFRGLADPSQWMLRSADYPST